MRRIGDGVGKWTLAFYRYLHVFECVFVPFYSVLALYWALGPLNCHITPSLPRSTSFGYRIFSTTSIKGMAEAKDTFSSDIVLAVGVPVVVLTRHQPKAFIVWRVLL